MSYPKDLLDQARHLANKERRRPKQASLRRAISDAYYSLFHLLIDEGAKMLVTDRDLRRLVQRCFLHTEMKEASRSFASGSLRPEFQVFGSVPSDLAIVAGTFVDLQETRNNADYNFAVSFTRTEANDFIARVEQAFASWEIVKNQRIAQVYLAHLLLLRKWKSN